MSRSFVREVAESTSGLRGDQSSTDTKTARFKCHWGVCYHEIYASLLAIILLKLCQEDIWLFPSS